MKFVVLEMEGRRGREQAYEVSILSANANSKINIYINVVCTFNNVCQLCAH